MKASTNIVWHQAAVTREKREKLNRHKSVVVWFTGLSASGKSTIAHALEKKLYELGCRTFVFDGDNVRHGLCSDLGFSKEGRAENIRRIGAMSKLFVEAGVIALTAFISPFRQDRQRVRNLLTDNDFLEVYCRCPLDVCEQRDIKGHYRRARAGEIKEFTGISSPYEAPVNPDLTLNTADSPPEACVDMILGLLYERGVLGREEPALTAAHKPEKSSGAEYRFAK